MSFNVFVLQNIHNERGNGSNVPLEKQRIFPLNDLNSKAETKSKSMHCKIMCILNLRNYIKSFTLRAKCVFQQYETNKQ